MSMKDLILKMKMLIENSQFNKGLSDSNKELQQLNKTADAVNKALNQQGNAANDTGNSFNLLSKAGLAVGASIAAIMAASTDSTRELLALNKELNLLNAQLGVSRDSMQLWQRAASDIGVDIADVFKDVSEKIAEFASTGGGEAVDLFKRINIDVKELIGLAPDQQLLKITNALNKVQNMSKGEKIFLLESLANDASKLLPLLDNNAKALRDLEQQLNKNQIFITPDQQKELDESNKRLKELGLQAEGVRHKVGTIGAEFINAFGDDASKAISAISKLIDIADTNAKELADNWRFATQQMATDSDVLTSGIGDDFADLFADIGRGLANTIGDGLKNLPIYAQQISSAVQSNLAQQALSANQLANSAGAVASNALSDLTGWIAKTGVLGEDASKGLDSLSNSLDASSKQSEIASARAKLLSTEIAVQADASAVAALAHLDLAEAKKSQKAIDEQIARENAEFGEQTSVLDTVNAKTGEYYVNQEEVTKALKTNSDALKEQIKDQQASQDAIKKLNEDLTGQAIALEHGQIAAKYYAERISGISEAIAKAAAGNRQYLAFLQESKKLQNEGDSIGLGLRDKYALSLKQGDLGDINLDAVEQQAGRIADAGSDYKDALEAANKSTESIGKNIVVASDKAANIATQSVQASTKLIAQMQVAASTRGKELSVINKVSAETGTDKTLMQTMAWIESRFNGQASNSSGYKGLYQFGHGTSKQYGVAGNEFDIEANTRAYVKLLQDNTAQLKKYGLQITGVNQYLAHQQGAYGLKEITKEATGQGTMRADVRRNMLNNKPDNMQGNSAAAFLAAWGEKYAQYEAAVKAINGEQTKLTQETVKTTQAVQSADAATQAVNQATQQQIASITYEADIQGRKVTDKERESLLTQYMGNQAKQAIVDAQQQADAIGLTGYQLRQNKLALDGFNDLQQQVILDAESNVDYLAEEHNLRQQLAAINDPWAEYKGELSQKRISDAQQLLLVQQKQKVMGEQLIKSLKDEAATLQMTEAQKYAHQLKTQGQSDAYIKLASSIRASNLALEAEKQLADELDSINLNPIELYQKQLINQGTNPADATNLADQKRLVTSAKITKELDQQLALLGASNLEQLEYEYRQQGLNELQIQYNLSKAKALEIGKQELQVVADLRDGLEGAMQSLFKGGGFDFGSIADGLQKSLESKVFKASFDADFGNAKSIKDLFAGLQKNSFGNNIQQYAQQFGIGGLFQNAGQTSNLGYGLYSAAGGAIGKAMFGSGGDVGGSIGAAIGTAIAGPIGGVVGTFLGGLAGSILGGKYEKTGGGVRLAYSGGGVYGNEYTDEKKDGGWFKKDKKRRTFDGLDTALQEQLNTYFDSVETSLVAQADALSSIGVGVGKEAAQSVIDGFGSGVGAQASAIQQIADNASSGISDALVSRLLGGVKGLPDDVRKQAEASFKEIDLTGKSEAEQKKLIEDWAKGIQDQLYKGVFGTDFEALKDLAVKGETTTQTFSRLVTQMQSMQSVVEMVGGTFDATGADIVKASDAIVKLFGSVESLNSAAAFFYENYYTEDERKQKSIAKATKDTANYNAQLAALGFGTVKTRDDLKNLLAGLDETSVSGQKAYLVAMQLAQSLDVLADAQEAAEQAAIDALAAIEEEAAAKAEANAKLAESLRTDIASLYASLTESGNDDRISKLKEQISTEQSYIDDLNRSIQQRYEEELNALNEMRRAAKDIGKYLESLQLSELSILAPMDKLAEAQNQYASTLSKAKNGDKEAAQNLPEMARQYLTIARDVYASGDDYTAIFGEVNTGLSAVENAINALPEPSKPAEIASLLIPRLENQIAAIEAQTEFLRKQELAKDIGAKLEELSLATGQDIKDLAESLGISLAELAKYGETATGSASTGTSSGATGTASAAAGNSLSRATAKDATDKRILDFLTTAKFTTTNISKAQADYVAGVLKLNGSDVYSRTQAMYKAQQSTTATTKTAQAKTYTKAEISKFNAALEYAQALNGNKRIPQDLGATSTGVWAQVTQNKGVGLQELADYLRNQLKYTGKIKGVSASYAVGADVITGNPVAQLHNNEMVLNSRQAGSVRDNLVLAIQGMAKIGKGSVNNSGLSDDLLRAVLQELAGIKKAIGVLANDGNSNADVIADILSSSNSKLQSILNAQSKPTLLKGAAA